MKTDSGEDAVSPDNDDVSSDKDDVSFCEVKQERDVRSAPF